MPNKPEHSPSGESSPSGKPTGASGIGDKSNIDTPRKKGHLNNFLHGLDWKIIWSVFIGIAAFIGASTLFVVGWASVQQTINDSVDKKLNDEAVLRKFAGQLRPTLIFDSNAAITEDWGAAQFVIGTIEISTNDFGLPKNIHIEFNKHLASAPILTPMYDSGRVIPKRAKGFSWDFSVEFFIAPDPNDSVTRLYRLELAP